MFTRHGRGDMEVEDPLLGKRHRDDEETEARKTCECSVCMQIMTSPTTLPCGHSLDRECALQTFKTSRKCPLCRAEVPARHQLTVNVTLKEMCRLACPEEFDAVAASKNALCHDKDVVGGDEEDEHEDIPDHLTLGRLTADELADFALTHMSSVAYCRLGQRYEEGIGVDVDERRALAAYRAAARMGDRDAQHALGALTRDVAMLRRACRGDSGSAQAFFDLAEHETERGERRQALLHFRKAADKGSVKAMFELGMHFLSTSAHDKAAEWFKKASEHNCAHSMYQYAKLLRAGVGCSLNVKESNTLFIRSSYSFYLSAAACVLYGAGFPSGEPRLALAKRMFADIADDPEHEAYVRAEARSMVDAIQKGAFA